MKKKKKKIARFTRGEKLLYALAIICICSTFVLKIFVSASTSNLKIQIEKINSKIEKQKNTNESLTMQVNELTSYENMDSVLKDLGLAYNNENIIIIDKNESQ